MASVSISNPMNSTCLPLRPTYVNLYRWPESDAEFVKMVSSNKDKGTTSSPATRVVDSISCRQMYLRSYTFSRKKESVTDKTIKCLSRFKQRVVVCVRTNASNLKGRIRNHEVLLLRRAKEASCAAFFSIFYPLLSCSSKMDEDADF